LAGEAEEQESLETPTVLCEIHQQDTIPQRVDSFRETLSLVNGDKRRAGDRSGHDKNCDSKIQRTARTARLIGFVRIPWPSAAWRPAARTATSAARLEMEVCADMILCELEVL
jgi:hypothetical protein